MVKRPPGYFKGRKRGGLLTVLKASKFDQFKVSHEIYNDNFHDLLSYIGNKNYFGIKDIKKWLENGRNKNKEEKLNEVKVEGDVNNGIEGRIKKEIQVKDIVERCNRER